MTTTTDLELAEPRKRLAQEDRGRIEQQRSPRVGGIVEPAPPYHVERRKLPAWAAHLRHLRRLVLVE